MNEHASAARAPAAARWARPRPSSRRSRRGAAAAAASSARTTTPIRIATRSSARSRSRRARCRRSTRISSAAARASSRSSASASLESYAILRATLEATHGGDPRGRSRVAASSRGTIGSSEMLDVPEALLQTRDHATHRRGRDRSCSRIQRPRWRVIDAMHAIARRRPRRAAATATAASLDRYSRAGHAPRWATPSDA